MKSKVGVSALEHGISSVYSDWPVAHVSEDEGLVATCSFFSNLPTITEQKSIRFDVIKNFLNATILDIIYPCI